MRSLFTILVNLLFISTSLCAQNASTSNESLVQSITKISVATASHDEFPEDLFTAEQRKHGAILLHCLLAVYCFLIIAIVCTSYFMPTIERICQVLKISDDVAAATFMSIATSSPELFTNIIGTFITNSDIGVGHVLGNAYYDMFFVAFLGGISASKNIVLDWWAITRDCGIYLVVTITLTWTVWDGQVDIHESLLLLILYLLYFVIMFSNRAIIRILNNKFNLNIVDAANENIEERESEESTNIPQGYIIVPVVAIEGKDRTDSSALEAKTDTQTTFQNSKIQRWCNQIGKLLVLPIVILTAITIPDVRKPKLSNMYPISFVLCMCWIGFSTYLGTWMISTIGDTIGVPDIIMGMVFMAAGGSVVEAYGVWYKTRRGECSIGLSNSMGCNTLDVTMCLALPWLIKSFINRGSIDLASQVLHFNCGLLIISVIAMFLILYLNKFTLNWKLGVACGISYVTVLAIAITLEVNQTGSLGS